MVHAWTHTHTHIIPEPQTQSILTTK
jgi:hypothetical protein